MAQSAASDLADNIPFVHRQGNYTRAEHAKQYQPNSYFVDNLSYTEFLDEQKMLLLEDGRSVGAVYELTMIPTEGRSSDYLGELRTQVTDALQDNFKQLTKAQIQLITSVRKENRKYTEGVLLSSKQEALFRVVPPSIYLALAMAEPEEKAERAELMRKYNISELYAALKVAENIDRARGILH